MSSSLRVIFAGTPEFALPSLQSLVESDVAISAVLTQPDRPKGRGRRLTAPPIKQYAEEQGLAVRQTERITTALIDEMANLRPDVMVVVAYGLILPARILALPQYGCINVHASLLPRWRGAAPVARAIEAGDRVTGVTIMQMNAGLDTGPILAQAKCAIASDDTTAVLQSKLAELGAQQLIRTLRSLPEHRPLGIIQDENKATYASKLTVQEAWVDWRLPAITIERKIHALNPWPGARAVYQGEPLRLWSAEVVSDHPGAIAGELVASAKNELVVQTGRGVIRLLSLQREGKRQLPAAAFLAGYPMPAESRFTMLDGVN